MQALNEFLSVVAGIVAAASVLTAAYSKAAAYQAAKRKLKAAEADSFDAALQSDNLITLGRYLDENIGAFDISEYVANDVVADRVDHYISRIHTYLVSSEDVDEQENIESPAKLNEQPGWWIPESWDFPEPFPQLFEELMTGDNWNALAKLRRHLEIELRDFAIRNGFKEQHLKSAGQMVQILGRVHGIDFDALERLRYSISVCNRAMHGRDVSDDEAGGAMWNGAIGLTELVRPIDKRPR